LISDTEGLRDDRWNGGVVGHGRQFDEPDPIARAVQELGGYLQGEARLARSSGTRERHQASRFDQCPDVFELLGPSDEGRQLGGQIVDQSRIVERSERGELNGKTLDVELEDLLGAAQVLQTVYTEICQRRTIRK